MIIYGQWAEKLVSLLHSRYSSKLRRVPAIKKPLFWVQPIVLNNNLLFYMKIEICFLYKWVSYSQEPAVYKVICIHFSSPHMNCLPQASRRHRALVFCSQRTVARNRPLCTMARSASFAVVTDQNLKGWIYGLHGDTHCYLCP